MKHKHINPPQPASASATAKSHLNLDDLPKAALIREKSLLQGIVPFSSATLWRRVRDGAFPAPIRLEGRITVWRVCDVMQWLNEQALRKEVQ